MKTCSKCKEEKELEEFTANKANKDGLQYFCKPCGLKTRREWMAKNKDRQRHYGLKANYDITIDEYEALLEGQQRACAICFTDEPGGKTNTWHVDHCHFTYEVRGILCHRCNSMLGQAQDKPMVLRNGAAYLEASWGDI